MQASCPETETGGVIFHFPSTIAQCLCLHRRVESLTRHRPTTLDLGSPLQPLGITPDRAVSCLYPANTRRRLGSSQQP